MSETARILVVESQQTLCARIAELLRAAGYAVDIAHSGREAVLQVSRARYSRVVLDPMLPDIAGIMVYLMLRGMDPELGRHVLFVPASGARPGPQTDAREVGLGQLEHPFAAEELLERLALR